MIKHKLSDNFFENNKSKLISQKNSDIGSIAVEIVKDYFLFLDPNNQFIIGRNNEPDLIVVNGEKVREYEIKGTKDNKLAFNKIKISSQYCYRKLIEGMEIIRVTDIGKQSVSLHFLKNNIDFVMEPEDRWKIKKTTNNAKILRKPTPH
jgi:hypothetical protein